MGTLGLRSTYKIQGKTTMTMLAVTLKSYERTSTGVNVTERSRQQGGIR